MRTSVGTRVNTALLVVVALTGLAILAVMASRSFAGPLDPPAPPGSTFGVREAGTPIESVPFTISQPGRYYLTRDLTASASGTAISIAASDVTVDLGGFTLSGPSSSSSGIRSTTFNVRVRVLNGTVKGFANAIDLGITDSALVSNVDVHGMATGGVGITTGQSAVIEDCVVSGRTGNAGGIGIVANGEATRIRNCVVTYLLGPGIVLNNGFSVLEDSTVIRANLNGTSYGVEIKQFGFQTTIRNNNLSNGPRDIGVGNINGIIVDNVIHCPESIVTLAGGGDYWAPTNGVEHSNIPRFASGFC